MYLFVRVTNVENNLYVKNTERKKKFMTENIKKYYLQCLMFTVITALMFTHLFTFTF